MGVSVAMQRIYASVQRARSHRYPILIVGETGTGKELVARCIHSPGPSPVPFSIPRKDDPFTALDCTALAPALMEPELFGYAKDAFIGTPEAREGLMRLAGRGTLFLREIADLPLKIQAKLFQALQAREFSPVGSTERFPFRARLMTSTRKNLGQLVADGAFREDLYFQLSAVQIELPPLRLRKADVPLLASHFLEKYAERGQTTRGISDAAMQSLLTYSWPGNILELERAIRWAISFTSSAVIEVGDLPRVVRGTAGSKALHDPAARLSIMQPEYLAIITALDATGGDRAAAAHLLRMAESTLESKLQSYGL